MTVHVLLWFCVLNTKNYIKDEFAFHHNQMMSLATPASPTFDNVFHNTRERHEDCCSLPQNNKQQASLSVDTLKNPFYASVYSKNGTNHGLQSFLHYHNEHKA